MNTITKKTLSSWVSELDEDGSCDISDRQVEELIRSFAKINEQCDQLAAENAQMLRLLTDISENHDEYVNQDDYLYAGVPMDYVSEINAHVSRDVEAENPFKATDAFLAEVRAQGVEMFASLEAKCAALAAELESKQKDLEECAMDKVELSGSLTFTTLHYEARETELNNALCELLPGTQYMDPPDGGSVTPLEQVSRMVEDYRQRIAELEASEIKPAQGEVLVTVTGYTGSGKSAIAGEIEIAMKAIGVPVEWTNGNAEKRMTGADWLTAIEMYKPNVRIVEVNVPRAAGISLKIEGE